MNAMEDELILQTVNPAILAKQKKLKEMQAELKKQKTKKNSMNRNLNVVEGSSHKMEKTMAKALTIKIQNMKAEMAEELKRQHIQERVADQAAMRETG